MPGKVLIVLLFFIVTLFLIPNTLADATFKNELDIRDSSLDFCIDELYTGNDAEAFRINLDIDENRIVNSSEVDIFSEKFETNASKQYLGYIVIDNGESDISMHSFDLMISDAEGPVDTSPINVRASVGYDLSASLSSGRHSIWILGHPAIEKMVIALPKGVQLSDVDGIDELNSFVNDGRLILEGRSGIRSFIVDSEQTFEYAVRIETYKSPFIADLSRFPSLF